MCLSRSQDKLVILVPIRILSLFLQVSAFFFSIVISRLLFFYSRFYVLFTLGFFVENVYALMHIYYHSTYRFVSLKTSCWIVWRGFEFKQLERTTYLVYTCQSFKICKYYTHKHMTHSTPKFVMVYVTFYIIQSS